MPVHRTFPCDLVFSWVRKCANHLDKGPAIRMTARSGSDRHVANLLPALRNNILDSWISLLEQDNRLVDSSHAVRRNPSSDSRRFMNAKHTETPFRSLSPEKFAQSHDTACLVLCPDCVGVNTPTQSREESRAVQMSWVTTSTQRDWVYGIGLAAVYVVSDSREHPGDIIEASLCNADAELSYWTLLDVSHSAICVSTQVPMTNSRVPHLRISVSR